jgi:alpha-L-fucosidase
MSHDSTEYSLRWFKEAKFGMFIHWGLYSIPAGTLNGIDVPWVSEWLMRKLKVPVSEYEKLASRFNPLHFNARKWVRTAVDAGMKYIVITSKHHDGFAMFHSKCDSFNIVDATPFGRDPLAELAEECRKAGIRLGFYYSQDQDWHEAGASGNT